MLEFIAHVGNGKQATVTINGISKIQVGFGVYLVDIERAVFKT